MKSVLLIGLGRFGRHIAKKLYSLGHEVMAVDSNEERVDTVGTLCPHACRNIFFGSFAVTPTDFREHFIEPTHSAN